MGYGLAYLRKIAQILAHESLINIFAFEVASRSSNEAHYRFSSILTNPTNTVGKNENEFEKPCGNATKYCFKVFLKKFTKKYF